MKWIGQHILDLISRFRSDVYLDNPTSGNPTKSLGLDTNNKVVYTSDYSTIKVLPHHFLQNNEGGVNKSILYDDSGTIGVSASHADAELYAFVEIPIGKTASSVTIYGSDTANVVNAYEADVNASGLTDKTHVDGCVVGTACDITDVAADTTNYLVIKVTVTAVTDIVYGGTVTLI